MSNAKHNKRSIRQDFKDVMQWMKTFFQRHPLVATCILILCFIAIVISLVIIFGFDSEIVKNLGFNKPLWDWMDLLIVPIVLAIAAYLLNKQQKESELRVADRNKSENQVRDDEKESRETFHEFIDSMNHLFLEHGDQLFSEDDPVRTIAQAKAKHALAILNPKWRVLFFQFLIDSGLSKGGNNGGAGIFRKADLRFVNLDQADLPQADLQKANLQEIQIKQTKFKEANFKDAHLERAWLRDVILTESTLQTQMDSIRLDDCEIHTSDMAECNLSCSRIKKCKFINSDLSGAVLERAILWEVVFENATLFETKIINSRLRDVNFRLADLRNSDFSDSKLIDVDFTGADLTGMVFNNTSLDARTMQTLPNEWQITWEILNEPQSERELSNVLLENVYLEGAFLECANLENANLRFSDLRNAKLNGANLKYADLTGTNIEGIELQNADLRWVNWIQTAIKPEQLPEKERLVWEIMNPSLQKGNLSGLLGPSEIGEQNKGIVSEGQVELSDLSEVDMSEVNLSGANLTGANLSWSDLSNSNLEQAILDNADLSRTNLKGAIMPDDFTQAVDSIRGAIMPDGSIIPPNQSLIEEALQILDKNFQPDQIFSQNSLTIQRCDNGESQIAAFIISEEKTKSRDTGKSDVAVVLDVARPVLRAVAKYLDEQQIDADFVLFRHVNPGSFLSVEDDWEDLVKAFSQTMTIIKGSFDSRQIRFFLAGPVSLVFAMGCLWGTVDQAIVYHYEANTYYPVLNVSRSWRYGS